MESKPCWGNGHLLSGQEGELGGYKPEKVNFGVRRIREFQAKFFFFFLRSGKGRLLVKNEEKEWEEVLSEVKVAQSCPTLCNPVSYTVHGILQARILEWVAFPFFRESSQPRDRTQVSRIAGRFFTS